MMTSKSNLTKVNRYAVSVQNIFLLVNLLVSVDIVT